MIFLDLYIEDKKFYVPTSISDSFKSPILMKLDHKVHSFFTTYVIIDFMSGIMRYIQTFSPENQKKCDGLDLMAHSHAVTSIVSGKEFFDFLYNNSRPKNNHFKYIDVDNKSMIIYSAKDLDIKDSEYLGRTSQHGTNREDRNSLVISFGRTDKSQTETYICSKNMESIKKLFTLEGYKFPQHSVETFKGYLFTTEFEDVKFIYNGEIINGEEGIERILLDKFNHNVRGLKDSLKVRIFDSWVRENFHIDDFELCPGEILLFNLSNLEKPPVLTYTGFAPSHIQFDEDNDMIYTSSHNFLKVFNKLFLSTQSVIYKYQFVDGNLNSMGSFTHPTFWRCPDHMIFKYKNKSYISAMGYPNRLFFIDCETMNLHYYFDIGGDVVSNIDNLRSTLNNMIKERYPCSLSSIASDDGKYITFWDQEHMHILDFEKRFIIHSTKIDMGDDFIQNTTHSVHI